MKPRYTAFWVSNAGRKVMFGVFGVVWVWTHCFACAHLCVCVRERERERETERDVFFKDSLKIVQISTFSLFLVSVCTHDTHISISISISLAYACICSGHMILADWQHWFFWSRCMPTPVSAEGEEYFCTTYIYNHFPQKSPFRIL
jgi:Na+/melibiose symporter-like transporter